MFVVKQDTGKFSRSKKCNSIHPSREPGLCHLMEPPHTHTTTTTTQPSIHRWIIIAVSQPIEASET